MGIRGSATYELVFTDCKIPKENLLGQLGKGFKMALMTLDGGRIGVAAQALGIAQGAIDHCKKYVTEHMQGEQKISEYQFTQFELADMQTRVDAARLLVYRAAQAKQDHEPFSPLAAMGKLYAAEAATNVTRRCAQLADYDGYSRKFPFERFMRDAKITEIYEGQAKFKKWLFPHIWELNRTQKQTILEIFQPVSFHVLYFPGLEIRLLQRRVLWDGTEINLTRLEYKS